MCLVSFQNLSSYYPVNKNKWDPLDTLLKQSPHQPSVVAFSTPCSIFHILEHVMLLDWPRKGLNVDFSSIAFVAPSWNLDVLFIVAVDSKE